MKPAIDNKYEDNILSLYLHEINKISLLSRDEEDEIARKAVKGDKKAQDTLVKANLRFVVNVAKKFQNQGLPLDDLISEGNIGLMNAIDRYDPDKDITLSPTLSGGYARLFSRPYMKSRE
jgi:RNA polymerase primary sigma factor